MGPLNRRRLLGASAALASATLLGACGNSSSSGSSRDYLTWWDHQGNQKNLHQNIFNKFAKGAGGLPVHSTFRNASKMGQALQLAKQSDQLPDVHTNAGLSIPVPALIKAGWVAPLDLSDAAMHRLKGELINGIHIFDGKVYTFPQFNYHTYSAATWFNVKLIKKAGLDPDKPPTSYDAFRAAARTVREKAGGDAYGWVWNAGMPPRMEAQVDDLAQAAGFEGGGGMLYRTGEYAYHSDPYVNAIEFLVAMTKDKLMMPSSTSFSDQIARARWVTGAAGYFIDGPWNPGVIRDSYPSFADSLGVGPILLPDAGKSPHCYAAPQAGVYFLSPTAPAKQQKAANVLLGEYFTTKDYFTDLAGWMPQPPLDLTVIKASTAYPSWKKLVGWMADAVNLAPSPVVKNVEVTKVEAEANQIQPGLGDIVQGSMSGDISDIRGALKKLSDGSSAERERALKAAAAKGAEVDISDYAFPNWQPGADYSTDMYQ